MSVVTENRMRLFSKMEERYEKKDSDYFVKLLDHVAIALGVNGSKAATQTLQDALNDPDKPVVELQLWPCRTLNLQINLEKMPSLLN